MIVLDTPALKIGTILWIFQHDGNVARHNDGSHKALMQLCNILEEVLSIPADFSVFNEIRVS